MYKLGRQITTKTLKPASEGPLSSCCNVSVLPYKVVNTVDSENKPQALSIVSMFHLLCACVDAVNSTKANGDDNLLKPIIKGKIKVQCTY